MHRLPLPHCHRRARARRVHHRAGCSAKGPDRILIVVSGEGRDQGKTRPGYEMDELSQAWAIFRDNGFDVHIASPQAARSRRTSTIRSIRPTRGCSRTPPRCASSRRRAPRATLKAEDYAGVFVVGGKGAMFDLPKDKALSTLIGRIHDHGGVVSAVCHGPAALVDVRTADGTLLVDESRQSTGSATRKKRSSARNGRRITPSASRTRCANAARAGRKRR